MRNKNIKIIRISGILPVPVNTHPQSYRTPFSLKSTKWYDEISDSDPFNPSCLHLHSEEGPYKMNVYTGEIYNTQTKKIIDGYYIREKDLIKLWNEKKFYAFALVMRKRYFDMFPNGVLPEIPSFCKLKDKDKGGNRRNVYGRRNIYVRVKIPMTHRKK